MFITLKDETAEGLNAQTNIENVNRLEQNEQSYVTEKIARILKTLSKCK